MLLMALLLNLLIFAKAGRNRRYLIYPDGGPVRAQFIMGLGMPVDSKDAAITVGTVIKFQYYLPKNSTEYTSRIYGFANTVSRDINGNEYINENENNNNEIDAESTNNDNDFQNNETLLDITFDERKKRAIYTEGGAIDNNIEEYDINTDIPLEEAIRRQEILDEQNIEEEEPPIMNRWDFYKIMEQLVERYGYSGRPCMLRTICEAAEVSFTYENGLLGEIAHILFTPSTTKDSLSHHTDNEYHAAERLGRAADTSCESLFPECESSILDTFTGIGMDTLHKFGVLK